MNSIILQHNFKYVGMNQLSLQHQFIYIFETFIFKYKKYIFLDDIEQEKLSKEYTKLILNSLERNIDKNVLDNKILNINFQNYIIKNTSGHKYINNTNTNITINKNKILIVNFDNTKYIRKKIKEYLLNDNEDIKNIDIKTSNIKEIIDVDKNFKSIIKNKKMKQLIASFECKMINIERIYKTKQLCHFVRNIIKNNNNEKELIKILNSDLIKNSNFNKLISKFIEGDSLQK